MVFECPFIVVCGVDVGLWGIVYMYFYRVLLL